MVLQPWREKKKQKYKQIWNNKKVAESEDVKAENLELSRSSLASFWKIIYVFCIPYATSKFKLIKVQLETETHTHTHEKQIRTDRNLKKQEKNVSDNSLLSV